MKIKIIGYEPSNEDLKPSKIDMWYDRSQRSWIVQLKDQEDNQIGEAAYVHSKTEAKKQVNDWKKEFGLSE